MRAMTAQNALKLSAWLAVHEPKLFRRVLVTTQRLQASPNGRLGLYGRGLSYLGDDVAVSDVAADVPDISLTDVSFDPGTIDVSSTSSDAIANAVAAPPASDASIADAGDTSGFWSSVGSGVANVAGAVGKVASGLVSPQTVNAIGTTLQTFFKTRAQTAQVQAQQAAVLTQFQRASAGLAPAPIAYRTDPVTGAVVPVYQSRAGAVPLTPAVISQLSASTGLSPQLLIGGGIAVVILIALLAAR